jgi:hypothetical protein
MRKILIYQQFLESKNYNIRNNTPILETKLVIKDLNKYQKRGDALIKRLWNKEELVLNDGRKSVVIDEMWDIKASKWSDVKDVIIQYLVFDRKIEELVFKQYKGYNIGDDEMEFYDEKKGEIYFKNRIYTPYFKDEHENKYHLNDFFRTVDFGSSGSGRRTRLFETLQAVFLDIKQNSKEELTIDNCLDRYKKYITDIERSRVYTNSNIHIDENLINEFDESWLKTFCEISNELWNNKYFNSNITYSVYHISYNKDDELSPFKEINKKYLKFSKDNNYEGINFAKYCPADIYLISEKDKNDIIKIISGASSIESLTSIINGYFDEKLLIPISLKKSNSYFKVIINNEEGLEMPTFSLNSVKLSETHFKGIGSSFVAKSIWKTKDDINISMRFDSSDTSKEQDIDGEVEGISARQGKINLKAIRRIIKLNFEKLGEKNIGDCVKSYVEVWSDISKNQDDSKEYVKGKINEIYQYIDGLPNPIKDITIVQKDSPKSTEIEDDLNKLMSKLQSLQIIKCILMIYEKDESLCNDIITDIFRYALSIKTDKFDTPRYLRII